MSLISTDSDTVDTEQATESEIDTASFDDAGSPEITCADVDDFKETDCPSTDKKEGDNCVVFVDGTASTGGDGLSWQSAFSTIQEGVDAAYCESKITGACEVWVRQGDYRVFEGCRYDTVRLRPKVALFGGFSGDEERVEDRDHVHNVTRLLGTDGEGESQSVLHVVTGCDKGYLDGFTIAKGQSIQETWLRKDSSGAGMISVDGSVTLVNCVFSENQTVYPGAAIAQYGGELQITNTTFDGNWATTGAGAIYVEKGTLGIVGCTFLSNLSNRFGGAVQSEWSALTVVDSLFDSNEAMTIGGALSVEGGEVIIENSVFEKNSARASGGALLIMNSESSVIRSCRFSENESHYGGAVVISGTGEHSIENSIFANNLARASGGGLLVRDHTDFILKNSSFYGNIAASHGGGIITAFTSVDTPLVANTILWGNTPDQVSTEYQGTVEIVFSNVQDSYDGIGNISSDPLFVDASNGDFNLLAGSPCIDAANGDYAPASDYLGNARIDIEDVEDTGVGTPVYADMGAFEYQP